MEELVQVTRKNAPIIAKDLQALDAKVPGFFTDFNMGIDLANTFMDSANKIASHKIDIPAGSIGNIDLTNAFRDFGVTPEKMRELEQADRDTTNFMNASLDVWPIINVPKEIIQLVQGHEMGKTEEYKLSDYAIGVASVLSGGTVKTVKTIGKVVGTVEDIEKKAKNLEKAAKGGRSGEIVLDKVQTYEQARNKAMSLLGDLGADSQPFIGTMEKSAGYGKIVGRETADHKARWRLDYDPNKGMHINVEDFRNGKKDKAIKYAIPFEGDEETFKSLLKYLNK